MGKVASFGHSIYPGDTQGGAAAGRRPWPAVAAGLLWLAVGLSAGYWVLLAWGRTPVTPLVATASALAAPDPAAVARALGAVPPALPAEATAAALPAAASRYTLLGVVARSTNRGVALISVDGQPPRPYRVGAVLEGGLVLQSVGRLRAQLGAQPHGPATVELTLPELPGATP